MFFLYPAHFISANFVLNCASYLPSGLVLFCFVFGGGGGVVGFSWSVWFVCFYFFSPDSLLPLQIRIEPESGLG